MWTCTLEVMGLKFVMRAPRRWLLARTLFAVAFVLPLCYAARTSRIAKGQYEGWRMPDARWRSNVHSCLHTFEASVQTHTNTCLKHSQACFCERALRRKCTGGQITCGTSHFDMLEANYYAKYRRSAPATLAPLPPPPPPDDSDADAEDALCDCAMRLRGGGDQNVSTTAFSFFKQIPFHLERFFYKKEQAFHKWHHWWTSEHWWERLPGRTWNPVTLWWRIKQNGPYTMYGTNHVNPICKIIAFQMKEMLHLQTLALMGQVSKVMDKALRPKITEENWWDLFYYTIFSIIHLKQIYYILQEKKPVQFSQDDLELYELVFQNNQFSPRQFDVLKKKATIRHARKGSLLAKPGMPIEELLVLIRGECKVSVNGKLTNIVKPGGFVGELEFLRGEEQFLRESELPPPPPPPPAPASPLSPRAGDTHAPAAEASTSSPASSSPPATSKLKWTPGRYTGAVDITVEATAPVTYLSWRFEHLYSFILTDKNIALRLEAMLAKDLANKVLQTDTLAKEKKRGSRPSSSSSVASRLLQEETGGERNVGAGGVEGSPSSYAWWPF